MKCEICNGCGARVCPDDMSSLWYKRLCPECTMKVEDYIESLKPKVTILRTDCYYHLDMGDIYIKVPKTEANALYDYMKRERGE